MARRSSRKNIAPAEIRSALVESLDQEGRGVTHAGGKTIFIDGALPNEQVLYQSERIKPTFEIAKMIEVLKPSNQRVVPKCRHFGLCGGCKLQHFDFAAQVAAKQRMLENNFKHIGKVKPANILPPLFGPAWGYRYKARLSVRHVYKKGRVLVGFNEKGTRYVADMDTCEVLVPAVSALIKPLQDMIFMLDIRDDIPQIELAVGEASAHAEQGVIVFIFRIMKTLTPTDEGVLKAFADAHNIQIWTQTKGPDTIKPFYPLDGPPLQYSLPEFDLSYSFKPNEFTQVNPHINQVMIRRAMQLLNLQAGEKVADFFCGIGNFSLPIARSGADVLGLEGLNNLVERAAQSAALNQIENVKFGVVDLFKITEESLASLGTFDKWLIDPPRDGAYELVKAITPAIAPKIIVYVSCSPATLARDTDILVNQQGYTLSAAGIINMFPHTAHVESIALLRRG